MNVKELKPSYVYLIKGEEVVFKYVGSTGKAIFMPPGEPSFQDCFCYNDQDLIEAVEVRPATKEEREGCDPR